MQICGANQDQYIGNWNYKDILVTSDGNKKINLQGEYLTMNMAKELGLSIKPSYPVLNVVRNIHQNWIMISQMHQFPRMKHQKQLINMLL